MTTPYTLAFTTDESGTTHPAEELWIPAGADAVAAGFADVHGLLICGVGEEEEPPGKFVALGHGHTWLATWKAATAWIQAWWCVSDLYTDAATKERIEPPPRPKMPKSEWAVFIRPCEQDGTWRLEYVDAIEPGAVAVTVMVNPAVTA